MLECSEIMERALKENAPLVVRFPDSMQTIAAIGSLYWNQNNEKIQALVEVLLELSVRYSQGGLSARARRLFGHLNDVSYLRYVVRARHSEHRGAIDRYRRLLEVAKNEGFRVPKALELEDFLLRSVGKYWNPYHYPTGSWSKSERPVGVPWNPESV